MKVKLLVLFLAAIILMAGCSKPEEEVSEVAETEDVKSVEKEVNYVAETMLGEADLDGASVLLPENTFDKNVSVTLEAVDDYVQENFHFIGNPISIKVEGQDAIRLNQPATIKIKVPQEQLISIENEEDVFAAYHNGSIWEYFVPDMVDLTNGYVQFSTYHFSDYAVVNLSRDEQLKYYAGRMATNTWAKEDQEKNFVAKFEGYVNDMLSDAYGIENKETTRKIMQQLVKEIPYMGGMLVSAANGDELEFAENFSATVGKVILDQMELDGNIPGDVVTIVSTHSKVAGDLSEFDYEEALKDITKGLATAIISKNMVGKMMVAGAEIIDVAITDWTDKSIEDAYQAYKNGAEGEHGYDLDAGDYNELRKQMRGINHKIYSDAMKAYCKRNKISINDLSKAEEEKIRKETDIKLKDEFDNRIAKEKEINMQKEYHEKILKLFDERNLLTKGSFGYDVEMSLEDRIERLYLSLGQILSHTDKKFTTSRTAGENEISIEDVCKLLGVWYSDRTEGKPKYFEELKKMGHARKPKLENTETPETSATIDNIDDNDENTEEPEKIEKTEAPIIIEPSKKPEVKKGEYAWVLVEVIDGSNDEAWELQNTSEIYKYAPSYGRGTYSLTWTYIGESDDYYNPPYVHGESFAVQATWSTPPEVIYKDDAVSLTGKISLTANTLSAYYANASTGAWVDEIRMSTEDGKTSFNITPSDNYASKNGTVTAVLGEGSEGSKKVIELNFYSSNQLFTQYVYEWKKIGGN